MGKGLENRVLIDRSKIQRIFEMNVKNGAISNTGVMVFLSFKHMKQGYKLTFRVISTASTMLRHVSSAVVIAGES